MTTPSWTGASGEAWVRYAALLEHHTAPFGDAALDRLEPLAGRSAVDVGCGTGSTTRALRERGAQPVYGVDLSGPMVRAAEAAGSDVTYTVGDVQDWRPAEPVDVVFSRFGVMFFPDPVAAFAHLRAVTVDGGRLGFCAWDGPEHNPWFTLPMRAAAQVLGPQPPPPEDNPGPLSLSPPGRVEQVLTDAGWGEVRVEAVHVERPHPAGDAAAVAAFGVATSSGLAARLAERPGADAEVLAAELTAALAALLRPLERDGVVHVPMQALVVTSRA